MTTAFGNNIKVSIYGASHAPAIGVKVDGLPQGENVDLDELQKFLNRRAPGRNDWSTPRKEADIPEFVSGLKNGHLTGEPLEAVIRNTNIRPQDYGNVITVPRPAHADYPSWVKQGKIETGGGRWSARMTAPLCIAGGIVIQILNKMGINIRAHIYSIGDIKDVAFDPLDGMRGNVQNTSALTGSAAEGSAEEKGTQSGAGSDDPNQTSAPGKTSAAANASQSEHDKASASRSGGYQTVGQEFPVISEQQGKKMKELIARMKAEGDSVGGIIECMITGMKPGIGDALFGGLESSISQSVFAIPAVKGIEFGAGFAVSSMRGSENNDPFVIRDGRVLTETNNHGGILGGMSSGMPVIFRVAMKPTPSICKEQRSVDLEKMEPAILKVKGRHDPCIVPRAVPCVEAAAALAVYDVILEENKTEI